MKVLKITFVLILLITGMGALDASETEAESAADQPEAGAANELTSSTEAEATAAAEPLDSPVSIMDQPLDGSSFEAFTAGLAKVDEEATEKEYRSVMSSLDYLLFYDLGAKRDKATLYSRLDGLSPNQIRDKVAKSRGRKR